MPRYHISSCHWNIRNINNIILWHYSTISSTCRTVSNVNNIECEPVPWITMDHPGFFRPFCIPLSHQKQIAGSQSQCFGGPYQMIFLKTRRALAKFLLAMICSKARANSASAGGNPWGLKPLGTGAANGFPWRFGSLAMVHCIRGFRDGTN